MTWWRPVPVGVSLAVFSTTRPTATLSRCPSTATWQLAALLLFPTLRRPVSFTVCDLSIFKVKRPAVMFSLHFSSSKTHQTSTVSAATISHWNQANWSCNHWSHYFNVCVLSVSACVCVCVSGHVYSLEKHVDLLLPLLATDVQWQNRDVIAVSIDFIYKRERRKGGLCWHI